MNTKTKAQLKRMAEMTAKAIRKRTQISGWHEDEIRFPEAEYKDVLGMLEKAYDLGKTDAEKAAEPTRKALHELLGEITDWLDCGVITEKTYFEVTTGCVPMELLDACGYGERVRELDEDSVLEEKPAEERRGLKLCEHCIQGIKSREPLFVGPKILSAEEAEEENTPCEWCGEFADLYECH